jgi:hypothetical protein
MILRLAIFQKKKIVLNSRKNPINGDRVVVCVIMPAGYMRFCEMCLG